MSNEEIDKLYKDLTDAQRLWIKATNEVVNELRKLKANTEIPDEKNYGAVVIAVNELMIQQIARGTLLAFAAHIVLWKNPDAIANLLLKGRVN